MSRKKRLEAKARRAEARAGQPVSTEHGINRLSEMIHQRVVKAMSNLRLSLTLRIALFYVGQLLRTTLLTVFVLAVAFGLAQLPTIQQTRVALDALPVPEDGVFDAAALEGLPVSAAYYLPAPLSKDMPGFMEKLRVAFSCADWRHAPTLALYTDTAQGGLVAAFDLTYPMYVFTILLWGVLLCDLLRVFSFMRRRNKLNHHVLKPIFDMTEAAAALSANNLSDRINIAGTKNELKDLAVVINGMLDRIELSYNSQKQFVSDASHELRTPIAVIQGYAGMLERWGKTDKDVLDEGITAISQETASMKDLVERLLFLARHDKKTLMLEMESFDPVEVVSALHRDARLLSPAHTFEVAALQHANIHADKSMIKQLMRILLDNAIKYTPPGGRITLSLVNDGSYAALSVADTGAGISEADLPHIFDRFYRADTARKAQSGGHGLGLSIARIIVVAHGGKLRVRSKLGAGTTFSVLLPLEPASAEPGGAPVACERSVELPSPRRKRKLHKKDRLSAG